MLFPPLVAYGGGWYCGTPPVVSLSRPWKYSGEGWVYQGVWFIEELGKFRKEKKGEGKSE